MSVRVSGGDWTTVSSTYKWNSNGWTCPSIDLSDYAGSTVELAFVISTANNESVYSGGSNPDVASGWYVDDIAVEHGPIVFRNPEDFELGLGDWWSHSGMWQLGVPTAGPGSAYSGDSCMGTVLGGNYAEPPYKGGTQYSYLISPSFVVPSDNPRLRFHHWYSFSWSDYGYVRVRVSGGDWTTVSSTYIWNSKGWTCPSIDLSDYADSTVEIAFVISTANNESVYSGGSSADVASGWYVDDVAVEHGPIVFRNPDDFELGLGDWWAQSGMWQLGVPTAGPSAAYSGDSCVGTVLGGNYPEPPYRGGSQTSRLISPPFVVPPNNPRLRFFHWYDFSWSDYGYVQMRVNGGDWMTISDNFTWTSAAWTPYQPISLSDYVDSTVEIAFVISTMNDESIHAGGSNPDVAPGWYIDDVRIEPIAMSISCPGDQYISLCSMPTDYCLPVPVHGATSVSVLSGNATWADDTLCVPIAVAGDYDIVIEADSAGVKADTCEFTVFASLDIPLTLSSENLLFASTDTATVAPDPQMLYIESPCDTGSLDWVLTVASQGDWLQVDKTAGTNPDSVVVSIVDPPYVTGTYDGLLIFSDNATGEVLATADVSFFVESGVDVGTELTMPGTTVKIPVTMATTQPLSLSLIHI